IRNVDVIRRQLAVALRAIASCVSSDQPEAVFPPETVALIRDALRGADAAAGSLLWLRRLPARWRGGLPYATASRELRGAAAALAALPGHRMTITADGRERLSGDLTEARRSLAADATGEQVAGLPVVARRIA